MRLRILLIVAAVLQGSAMSFTSRELLTPVPDMKGGVAIAQNAPEVEMIVFKDLSNTQRELWSSWGNGCLATNGKYYTTIGDHRGYDGNSYVYEYDPSSRLLKKIVDVAAAIGLKKGSYGYGKIHAGISEYRGSLYFATYRGDAKEIQKISNYSGSLFFRYDLKSGKLENLGTIAQGEDLPTALLDPARGLLYFYTVEKGDLLVYDLNKKNVKFKGGAKSIALYRAMMLDNKGRVFFTDATGNLSFYNPDNNTISSTGLRLPGTEPMLRSATRCSANGRIWGMTKTGRMFEFNSAKNTLKDLGPNISTGEYTAVMLLSPDEKYIYYAPGSHGSAVRIGTPLVQYEVASGRRKAIAFLRDALIHQAGYFVGGNYNMQIDPSGGTLYGTFNGAKFSQQKNLKPFGLPSIVIVKIPAGERK